MNAGELVGRAGCPLLPILAILIVAVAGCGKRTEEARPEVAEPVGEKPVSSSSRQAMLAAFRAKVAEAEAELAVANSNLTAATKRVESAHDQRLGWSQIVLEYRVARERLARAREQQLAPLRSSAEYQAATNAAAAAAAGRQQLMSVAGSGDAGQMETFSAAMRVPVEMEQREIDKVPAMQGLVVAHLLAKEREAAARKELDGLMSQDEAVVAAREELLAAQAAAIEARIWLELAETNPVHPKTGRKKPRK